MMDNPEKEILGFKITPRSELKPDQMMMEIDRAFAKDIALIEGGWTAYARVTRTADGLAYEPISEAEFYGIEPMRWPWK